MGALSLPPDPDLGRFRRDARQLQRAVRAGEAEAWDRVVRLHPDPPDRSRFSLSAAQHVIARSYGFASWPKLRAYLRTVQQFGRAHSGDDGDLAHRLLNHACLGYTGSDDPSRWAQASAMLAANPALTRQNVYVAAAAGDPDAVAQALAVDPAAARTEGGPWQWTALTYLAYSRIPQRDPIGAARLLLDSGADPNAGFLLLGLPTPFTVLTGCFGEGESGPGRQPRHPVGLELAALLLDAGADPNDAQTLYNRIFGRDDSHLELLLARGLGHGDGGPWQRRLGEALESPTDMVQRQVDWARNHGLPDRLDLLARHGFTQGTPVDEPSPWRSPDGPRPQDLIRTPEAVHRAVAEGVDLNALVGGRTMLHQAAFTGDVELIEALLAAGADPSIRDTDHNATALGWAEWAQTADAAEVLRHAIENPGAPAGPEPLG